MYPNATTHQKNMETAVSMRTAITFMATWSASLPQMMMAHDGLVGLYWADMAQGETVYDFIVRTVGVIFRDGKNLNDVSVHSYKNGTIIYVRREFGNGVHITIGYCWKGEPGTPETPLDLVSRALHAAWCSYSQDAKVVIQERNPRNASDHLDDDSHDDR